ncbi:MAG: hypothetical protein WDN00_04820 [Limisphaerales bacterium]
MTPTACSSSDLPVLPATNYVLQASTNLTDWTPLSTNLATTNYFNFFDPGASNFTKRFYRVQQE